MKLFGAPYPTLKRVIVNLKTGRAFRGVLWGRRDGWLILRNAEALQENGSVMVVDGEALFGEHDEVEFVQVLNP